MFGFESCLVSGYVSIMFLYVEVCVMSIWDMCMSHEEYVSVCGPD
jgi:hypothetical protein